MKRIFFVLLIMCPLISLTAQISIDRSELPDSIGMTWFNESDSNVTVNVGTTGGPQTWNFSFALSDPESEVTTLIEPSAAPSPDSFPGATIVMFSSDYPAYNDSTYIYYSLSPTVWTWIGMEFVCQDSNIIMIIDSGEVSLPINYLDTYRFVSCDTMGTVPNYSVITQIIDGVIDAYGTVNIPAGSFPALRIKSIHSLNIKMYVNNIPIFDTTTHSLSYEWMTEYYPTLVTACSEDTVSNFTLADEFSRFHGFTTVGVEEEPTFNTYSNSIILIKELGCYYVSFTDIQSTDVNIFDLTGRLNFTSEISGSGKLKLNLHNPGIYFITYDNSNTHQSDKLIIVK